MEGIFTIVPLEEIPVQNSAASGLKPAMKLHQLSSWIGQMLKDGGYETGMFGKWHLGDNYPYRPEDRGFTEVYRHGGGEV